MIRKIIILTLVLATTNAFPNHLTGLQPIFPNGRIIGGQAVKIEDYPHQVSLQYYNSHRCGGSVIAEDVILTAAHCIHLISTDLLKIRVGSSFKNNGGELVNIKKMWSHELYNPSTIDYDMGVIILEKKLTYGPTIQPIQLATVEGMNDVDALVSGWGNMQEGGQSPIQLHAVKIRIISNENCRKYYGETRITDQMMCAGVPEGGKGSCQGDSGGALTVNGKVVGVVSWAIGCSRPNVPTVFGNVVSLLNWIESKM